MINALFKKQPTVLFRPHRIAGYFLVFCLLAGFSSGAQYTIGVRVSDRNGQPLAQVLVSATGITDTMAVRAAYTDSGGHCLFAFPAAGSRRIHVVAPGYNDSTVVADPGRDTVWLEITLSENLYLLQDVQVSAARPLWERKADRLVFNVSASVNSQGAHLADILRKIPGLVWRQPDGDIQLVGKSAVQVWIDEQLLQLSGADLVAYLQAIPAEAIDRVEVITAPPASYDAAGNSGILRIVRKKKKSGGLDLSLHTGYEQASYGKWLAGGQVYYGRDKWSIFGNINYSDGDNQVVERLQTAYDARVFAITDNYRKRQQPLAYNIGGDYELRPGGTLGLRLTGNVYGRTNESDTRMKVLPPGSTMPDSLVHTQSQSATHNRGTSVQASYTQLLDTQGRKITFLLNRFWFDGNRENDFVTRNYKADGQPTGVARHNHTDGRQGIGVTVVQADAEIPLSLVTFSGGAKFSFVDNRSRNVYQYYSQGNFYDDPGISNAFDYTERVQAGYINLHTVRGKWTLQAGLRGELTQTLGYARQQEQTTRNAYFNLFPTAYLQYTASEQHQWNLSYSKRINRPDYKSLDPFRAYASPYYYHEGNPFLRPSFNHNIELSYVLKGRYTFSAFYQHEQDHFGSVWLVDSVTYVGSGVTRNFGQFNSYGLNIMASWQPWNRWEAQLMLSGQVQRLSATGYYTAAQAYGLPLVYAAVNNTIMLNNSKTLVAEVNLFYLSRYQEDFLELRPVGSVDIGVRALLWNKKVSCSLNAGDILATQKARGKHVVTGQTIDNYFDTRNLRFTLRYQLGKERQGNNGTGVDPEVKRAG